MELPGGALLSILFQYNPEGNASDSLYKIAIDNPRKILKVSSEESKAMIPTYGDFSSDRNKMLYTDDGKLIIYDMNDRSKKELISLPFRISDPEFSASENKILFQAEDNAFIYHLEDGTLQQFTNIKSGSKKASADNKKHFRNMVLQKKCFLKTWK